MAAVAKERMDSWLGALARRRHRAERVVLGGRRHPRHPGHARARHRGRADQRPQAGPRAVRVRRPHARAGAVAALATPSADEPELRHVRVFTDAAGRARFASELALLDSQFASADVKILSDVFPHLAATLAQRSGTNLLQGAYAPKSNWLAHGQTLAARRESRGRGRGAGSRAARRRILAAAARGRGARRRRGERLPACRRRLEHIGLPARDPPASRRERRRRDGGLS